MSEYNPKQIASVIGQYLSITRKDILKYIPAQKGNNPNTSFKLLIIIASNPKKTGTALKLLMGSASPGLESNLYQLVEIGYIKKVKKSTWINAIHAWRVNITYVLTKKGLFTLADLLKPIDIDLELGSEITEINYAQAS